jgi:hypothetical protein
MMPGVAGFRSVGVLAVAVLAVMLAVGATPADAVRPDVARAISCPSVSLCVATDDQGYVFTSTNPTGGAGTWKAARVASGVGRLPGPDLPGVSCPTVTLCVAHDEDGDLVTSTNPTGGAPAWRETLHGGEDIQGLTCPFETLCLGFDGATLITSTDPTAGASSWIRFTFPGNHILIGASCLSSTYCVVADGAGDLLTSTDPTGGQWLVTPVGSAAIWAAVSCVGTGCVAFDGSETAVSTNPSGGTGAWTVVRPGPIAFPPIIVCPAVTLCVAAGGGGHVSTTTDPFATTDTWRDTDVESHYDGLVGLSCPSVALCAAIDEDGNVVTSTSPAGGAGTWKTTVVDHRTHVIARADILSSIELTLSELTEKPKPSAAAIRKARSYSVDFDDLDTGSLRLDWYNGSPVTARHPRLVAGGAVSVPDTGDATVKLRLTAAGRKLVDHHTPLKLYAQATLTPAVGKPVTVTRTFTLVR